MKVFPVRQQLVSAPLDDPAEEARRQLDALADSVPQGPVAITCGSRGISNLAAITRAAGDWLRDHGAEPFLVPAMGSHNGATAEGQRAMVESLGMSEQAMGMPIRSSMECVKVGEVSTGDVWMDRHCWESAGVLVLNRVKLHTCFSGPVQSGVTKMMVVGMGKIRSAQTFHSAPTAQMKHMLLEMGRLLVDSGKIWAGLAILEDGFDETAELHALPAAEILQREPALLARHLEYFPRLPIDDINEFVTLASIVEKETALAEERPRVAGVFVNRLERGMRLQSDPTIIYGLFGGEGKPADRPIYQSDIESQTPYNTYVIDGLPPGPIAIPGRASLEAVANPARTEELYFVADGTGGHAFARSLDEHNANVRRWRQIEAERAAAREAAEEEVTIDAPSDADGEGETQN